MTKGQWRWLSVGKQLWQIKFNWQHGIHLIHAITSRCNARCGFCAWNPDCYDGHDELTTEQIKQLYRDASKTGFLSLSVWGGEPLLRKDLTEVVTYAKELGFSTSLVTNGALLERKFEQVVPCFDRICISVDHPSDHHDKMRGIPGLFASILRATQKIKERYPNQKLVYNYTIQKDNADPAVIEEMAQLIQSLGIRGIFNAMRLDAAVEDHGMIDISAYNPSQEALHAAFRKVQEMKHRGYPIVNSHTHLEKMLQPALFYRCHWPKFMLPIEANGDVVDCMHWGTKPIANVRQQPLEEILQHPRLKALAGDVGEGCHKCVSLHRVEVSELWEGRLEPLLSWGQQMF